MITLFCVRSLFHLRYLTSQSARTLGKTTLCKMGDKAVLDAKASSSNKYADDEQIPAGVFKGVSDRFNGITIDSNREPYKKEDFCSILENSLSYWQSQRKRGIWFKVSLDYCHWIPELANRNFKFHHAKENFVMMYRWLPTEESPNIPPFAHTMVGVGALVMNNNDEILVVSEKNALITGSWKLPGGYVEPAENLVDAAIREVEEETNIRTKFDSVVAIRHAHSAGFGCSDLYIVMALNPETSEIKKCEREISACEWMKVQEYLNHPNVHETNRHFVRTYLQYKEKGLQIVCQDAIHQILKKKYNIYVAEFNNCSPRIE